MSISQSNYINIVSQVGATAQVTNRDLIERVFTSNYLAPNNAVVEFTGGPTNALAAVGNYFGITSTEYVYASKYFGFISKKGTSPQKISFARYTTADSPAQLIGGANAASLSDVKSITDGTFTVVVNGDSKTVESINLSAATSLENAAELLTTAFSGASVDAAFTYDANTNRFVLATTATGADATIGYGSGDAAIALGMAESSTGSILSQGAAQQTPVECLTASAQQSNNFLTFDFLTDVSGNAADIASWVNAQNNNYLWTEMVTPENASTVQSAVDGMNGVCLTLDIYSAYASFMPGAMYAAIDWNRENAAINAMYQQFNGVQPSVTTDADKAKYDALKINYYGQTSQGGQPISFYQNGVLQGPISDMSVYVNEAWLKDSFFTNLMNLRLGLDTLPASDTGRGLVLGVMQETISTALKNGVILPGKTLTSAQKASITQMTNDSQAWTNVQSNGYWLDAEVVQYTEDGVEKYKINYTLIYAKGDSINKIDGSDIMI